MCTTSREALEPGVFSLQAVSAANIVEVRRLNTLLLPVAYDKSFYDRVCSNSAADELLAPSAVALIDGAIVGSICCIVEQSRVYIGSLGVLVTFRDRGIGSALLSHAIKQASALGRECIYLHVQVGNDKALRLYRRFGFEVLGVLEKYYRRIQSQAQPSSANLLQKNLCDD